MSVNKINGKKNIFEVVGISGNSRIATVKEVNKVVEGINTNLISLQSQISDLPEQLENDFTVAINEAFSQAIPYRIYIAKITQAGDSTAPIATVLENTLGGTITWARVGPGGYQGTFSGTYPIANKFWSGIDIKPFEFNLECVGSLQRGSTKILMGAFEAGGTPTDGFFADIEIRIYD